MRFPVTQRISVGTGDAAEFMLFRALENLTLERIAIGVYTAWAADGSNYWSMALKQYEDDGTELPAIPFDERTPTFSLDTISLAVGRVYLLPVVGYINQKVLKGQSVWLDLSEAGSVADLDMTVQCELRLTENVGGR